MKTFHRSMLGSLIFILTTASNQAAFIIEASNEIDALGFGNFAYTGAGGTVASYSDTSVGNLPAYTDIPQTFFTLRHAFGGNGTTDQYTFTYTPALHADNFTVAPGTLYNSMGVNPNLTATGLTGGTAGIYNVYRIHPNTTNVSGGNTTYQVAVGASVQLTEVINQNYSSELAALGKNIGRWELIGSVSVANATDT
ncbi:MAG TPA: hypothetical protein VLO11_08900, partial [Luteolibacter sp.]|nr:hypothetical protein [Luteolibacter sp.]